MKKKILFRADGNGKSGLGHLFRLFALVEIYKKDFDFVFLTRENSTLNVIPSAYELQTLPFSIDYQNEASWLAKHFSPQEYLLIVDGYKFDSRYQKQIKEQGYFLIYVDDLVQEYMYADILINHSLHVKKEDYRSESYTQFALGSDYAMLRPSFLQAARQKREIKKTDVAFVCFGGSDIFDFSLQTVQTLLEMKRFLQIHVVLGGAYPHKKIFALAEKNSTLVLHQNLNEQNLLMVMQKCNLAVVPASTILYEVCCVKMPVISGYYVENQKAMYKATERTGIVVGVGDFSQLNQEQLIAKISNLTSEKINTIIKKQNLIFHGKSDILFKKILLSNLIAIRRVTPKDTDIIYQWANDKEVRKNSYQSNAITYQEHEAWFLKKIATPNCLFFLAECNGVPAGFIRYEIKEDYATVGILVAESFRGLGLAAIFLKISSRMYFENQASSVLAFIKKTNKASCVAFEKAGYIFCEEKKIEGIDSFVYQLKKANL